VTITRLTTKRDIKNAKQKNETYADQNTKINLMKLELPVDFSIDAIAKILDLKTAAGREALIIALENVILLDAKQLDYGSRNISRFGSFGCIVRISDKMERINHMLGVNFDKPQKEKWKLLRTNTKFVENNLHVLSQIEAIEKLNEVVESLRQLFSTRRKRAINESIIDSFRDGSNYFQIAQMCETGKWPSEPKQNEP
jgi:hypothetical protein